MVAWRGVEQAKDEQSGVGTGTGTAWRRRFAGAPRGAFTYMLGLILTLLVIWLILAVLGIAIKGLFWLFIVGLILFVVTGIFGWVRRRT